MYKALNYWVYGGFNGAKTAQEFIDFAAKHGLDGIELTIPETLKLTSTQAECQKIADYAAAKKIRIRTIACGGFWNTQLGAEDPKERAAAVEIGKGALRIAGWLGAEAVLMVPGAARIPWSPDRAPESYKSVWEFCQDSVRKMIPTAEQCKVAIALENVWGRFLLSPMEWRLFLDQLASPWVGIYFDVGNCLLYGRPQDYVELLGAKYIKAIHLKNWQETDCGGGLTGFGDDLLKGSLDFAALAKALKDVGYQGPMAVEMIPFCRGDKMVLPDEKLAVKMTRQLQELETKYFV